MSWPGSTPHTHPGTSEHGVGAPVAGGGLGKDPRVGLPAAPRAQHRCGRCPMTFVSGQALGGHMRKHFLEDKELASNTPPPPSATPPPPPPSATPPPPPPSRELLGLDKELASAAPAPPSKEPLGFDEEMPSATPAPPSKGPLNFDLNEVPRMKH
ncbi:hypothetical protein GUJ93_ZPchr0004g39063 [Zizania palustris]|uniref:C2H2-type domain-containing protein n=1 Tax=Zizania palustris TaxID=103762 RepID=A0A8J5SBE9_ZIZPA|nr:hypothetical protein GUJ93_ZPchr0004g39063 [Zizania palustris]